MIENSKILNKLEEEGFDVSNIVELIPKQVESRLSDKVRVGKRSEGYTILQALLPLFKLDWTLEVRKGISEPVLVTLYKPGKGDGTRGKQHSSAEGPTFSVAMRRLSVGYSKQFSNMME